MDPRRSWMEEVVLKAFTFTAFQLICPSEFWRNRWYSEEKKEESLKSSYLQENEITYMAASQHSSLSSIVWDIYSGSHAGREPRPVCKSFRSFWSVSITARTDSPFVYPTIQVQAWATIVGGASVRWMSILSSTSQMSNFVYNQAQPPPLPHLASVSALGRNNRS